MFRPIMRPTTLALAALGLLALGGCSAQEALRRLTPAEADTRARAYLAALGRGQVDSALLRITPTLRNAETRSELEKVAALLAAAHADSMVVVGSNTNSWPDGRRVNLTYQLYARSAWSLANVATLDSAGDWVVEGVRVQPLPRPLEEATRFSLAGQPAWRYAWVLAMLLCAATSIGTALFIASRRGMPKRWRWVFVSTIGVGSFALNWASGETGVRTIYVQLFAAGAMRPGPYAPWILSFGLPVGALIALWKYRAWRTSIGTIAASPT